MAYTEIHIPWKGWKIVREIGHGSFGTVYEIERQLLDSTEKAAMKVIRIPRDDHELEQMYFTSGYDNALVHKSIEIELKRVEREYALMSQMRGISNIVSCEDFDFVQNEDGIGYTIYIRMQLLKSLNAEIKEKRKRGEYFTEGDVIRLGRDISSALSVCEQYDIIHRDIKPQNILVSPLGDYNLGDFGTARRMDHTTQATYAGTISFMAPEVFKREKYGRTVDIYSLGLVMYWLANRYRMPFVPLEGIPTTDMLAEAERRRVSGEPLPEPCGAGKDLSRIILKACAYKSEDRFSSASEMYEALCGTEASQSADMPEMKASVADEQTAEDRTVGMFIEPDQGTVEDVSEETAYMTADPAETIGETTAVMTEPSAKAPEKRKTRQPKKKKARSSGGRPKWFIPVLAAALIIIVVMVLRGITGMTVKYGMLTVADTDDTADPVVQEIADRMKLKVAVVTTDQPGMAVSEGKADILCGVYNPENAAPYEKPDYDISRPIYDVGESSYNRTDVCIVVKKGNSRLLEELDTTIAGMTDDGTLGKIRSQILVDDYKTVSPVPMVTFNPGGGEYITGEMKTVFSATLPACGYSNPGFTFAGWHDMSASSWKDYIDDYDSFYSQNGGCYSSKDYLKSEETDNKRTHKLIAEWNVDANSFETSKALHDKVEVEELSGYYGLYVARNNADIPVDVVLKWTNNYNSSSEVKEVMSVAIPAGREGLIYVGGSKNCRFDYYVRESGLTPVENSISIEIKENEDGTETAVITNTGEDVIEYLQLAYLIRDDEEKVKRTGGSDANATFRGTAILDGSRNLAPGNSVEAELIDSEDGPVENLYIGDRNDLNFFRSAVGIKIK